MSVTTRPMPGTTKVPLSRDIQEFLIAMAIAVHRFAMYPEEHPSLRPAVEDLVYHLSGLLQDRSALSIGIAQTQLLVEGVTTDEKNHMLSDLSRRMHGHQIGALSIVRGVTMEELESFLAVLSKEPDRGAWPVGNLPEKERSQWPNVRTYPIGYDHLEFKEGGPEDWDWARSRQLWVGLAQAALEEAAPESDKVPDGGLLARIIESRPVDAAYDQSVVGFLLQLAEELNGATGGEADEIRRQMSELIQGLDGETLRRLIRMGGGRPERMRFLGDVNEGGLAVESVVRILQAAADVDGQSISSSLARLLAKLAVHAEKGSKSTRAEAAAALRENVQALISDWELADPNPDAYTEMLDRLASAAPSLESGTDIGDSLRGSQRILQMALEVDAYGPAVVRGVADLLDEGDLAWILRQLDEAGPKSELAARLRADLVTPEQLRRLLAGEDVDEESLRLLVKGIGPGSLVPLFHYLMESESRAIRRKVFDVLADMVNDDVTALALEWLGDDRWYVKRNMLGLLRRMERLPESSTFLEALEHSDARVRREAFPLAAQNPNDRDRALALALSDEDERMVRMALLEVQESLPIPLVAVVVDRMVHSEAFPSLRSLAVRALGSVRSMRALEALVSVSLSGRSLFGRAQLAPRSPEVLIALSALARVWGDKPEAREVTGVALKSRDPQIRAAVQTGVSGS